MSPDQFDEYRNKRPVARFHCGVEIYKGSFQASVAWPAHQKVQKLTRAVRIAMITANVGIRIAAL